MPTLLSDDAIKRLLHNLTFWRTFVYIDKLGFFIVIRHRDLVIWNGCIMFREHGFSWGDI